MITKKERIERARSSCDGKVDADDVLALIDALGEAEASREFWREEAARYPAEAGAERFPGLLWRRRRGGGR